MYKYSLTSLHPSLPVPSYQMAASLLRSSLSFPSSFPGAEDSPTPPAKRFSPASNPEMATTRSKTVASIPSRKDGSERTTEHFARYGLALQVYSALRSGKLPGGVRYPDAETKRTVYRLVFDVLYRKIRLMQVREC